MIERVLQNPVSRAATSLLAGVSIGAASYGLIELATPPNSEQISNQDAYIQACARQLGSQAVERSVFPKDCVDIINDTYTYTKGSNTYYLLPSKKTLLYQEQSVASSVDGQSSRDLDNSALGAGIAAVAVFAGLTIGQKFKGVLKNRTLRRDNHHSSTTHIRRLTR
jgi:hypothetical protein